MRKFFPIILSFILLGCLDETFLSRTAQQALGFVIQLGTTTKGFIGGDNTRTDRCSGVAVDSSGYVYCAGTTIGSIGEANSALGLREDAFVMKISPTGTIVWVTQLGSVTEALLPMNGGGVADTDQGDGCNSVAVDNNGFVYCGGWTDGALDETNGGGTDAFVMKLDADDGSIVWITQLGANSEVILEALPLTTLNPGEANTAQADECKSVAVDSSGNVYCGGRTNGALGELNAATAGGPPAWGSRDAFVMRLDSSGGIDWITQVGDTFGNGGIATFNEETDSCEHIAINSTRLVCVGDTNGNVGETNGDGLGAGVTEDAFIVSLDITNGSLAWIRQLGVFTIGAGAAQFDVFSGVVVTSAGDVYAIGETEGALGEANGGGADAIIVKYNSIGTLQWVKQFGSVTRPITGGDTTQDEGFIGISMDSTGDLYLTGITRGDFVEANGGGGNYDTFIMKMDNTGTVDWVTQFGAVTKAIITGNNASNEICLGVAADSQGYAYCAGYTEGDMAETNDGNADIIVIKLNPSGSLGY